MNRIVEVKPIETWDELIIAIDEYIEMLKTLMNEDPTNGVLYQQKMATMMWYRQEAIAQQAREVQEA